MIIGLIPSRLNSMRLKRKPLLEIDGLPIIIHTYKRAKLCKKLDDVIVCADDLEIVNVVKKHGGKAILTSKKHRKKLGNKGFWLPKTLPKPPKPPKTDPTPPKTSQDLPRPPKTHPKQRYTLWQCRYKCC